MFVLFTTERSGAQLLRLCINQHPQLYIPPPSALARLLHEDRYGDLTRDTKFLRLAEDACRLVGLTPHPWPQEVDPGVVYRRARERSLVGVFQTIHEIQAAGRQWGTLLVPPDAAFLKRLPQARRVFLVRDPRNVAASAWNSIYGPYHPWRVAVRWEKAAEVALALKPHVVRYEDLIESPEAVLRRLCDHLEVAFEPAMLRFHESEEARALAAFSPDHAGLTRPLYGGTAPVASHRETARLEATAERGMRAFGYALKSTENERRQVRQPGVGSRILILGLDLLRRGLVEAGRTQTDPSFPFRLARLGFALMLGVKAPRRPPAARPQPQDDGGVWGVAPRWGKSPSGAFSGTFMKRS